MTTPLPSGPGVHVVVASALAPLVDAVATELAAARPDPFATDVVSVPGAGVQRWVAQQLATRLGREAGSGICAGLDFPTLPGLLASVVEEVTGRAPGEDPWRPERMQWAVLAELDAVADAPWARYATRHLGSPGDPARPGRRMSAAQRVAGLFHHYAADRPEMLRAWAQGNDVGPEGEPLEVPDAWQPRVWRGVRDRLGEPDPVTRLDEVCATLRAGRVGPWPESLVVLTPPRLSRADRRLVEALGAHRRVVVGLVAHAPGIGAVADDGPRRGTGRAQHRLTVRLGRELVEQRDAWLALADTTSVLPVPRPVAAEQSTVLARLLDAVRHDVPEADLHALPPVAEDHSLEIHATHGLDRQVEVLRDVLLRLLQEDSTLEPRDVVVLTPQLPSHAPLLTAAFAPGPDETPGQQLRVRIADRTLRQVNPVLAVVDRLMLLATGRCEASAVMDLAAMAPVARRFGLDGEDLERLRRLVRESGVRWGLDAQHRAEFGLGQLPQNTWEAGLGRLLAGVALTDEALTPLGGTMLPYDDVPAADVEAIGRLAELVDRLRTFVGAARSPRTARAWVDLLREAVTGMTDAPGDEAWQLTHAHATLADLADTLPEEGGLLGLGDARVMVADLMRGVPPRPGFGTGSLVVCSPEQLRHVPHRVVVLLGHDDAVFPRQHAADGDDLAARRPFYADADPRARERQLLLDAVMAAQERLVIVHARQSDTSNEPLPPAVPVTEFLDAVDQVVDLPGGAGDSLSTAHPLQPFSPREFGIAPDGSPTGLASFDRAAAGGATALLSPQAGPKRRWPLVVLPALEAPEAVELAELERTLTHPVRALLRQRGGLTAWDEEPDPADDRVPLDLDNLGVWAVGDRVLRLVRAGADLDDALRAEFLRGGLPPRGRGQVALEKVRKKVDHVLASTPPPSPERWHDVGIEVKGRTVRGMVRTEGEHLLEVSFSRPNARHLLGGWVQLCALTLAEPGTPWQWRMHGPQDAIIGPVPVDWARSCLGNLVELAEQAVVEPLPFMPKLSLTYAEARHDPMAGDEADVWRALACPRGKSPWDNQTDEVFRRFFPSLEELRRTPPEPDDCPGREESSRFGTLARRVFEPLLRWRIQ